MSSHANRLIALFTPPPEDPDFARVFGHLLDTVSRAAMRARTQCAIANGVLIFETEALITSDPDRPNFVTVTARPLAIRDPFVGFTMTRDEFEAAYARNCGKTVEWLRAFNAEIGRDIRPCDCGSDRCQGWQMVNVALYEEDQRLIAEAQQ